MLKNLQLENFRNYQKVELEFNVGAGLTYLIGDNAQGKTNLLEAIYAMILGKSFLGGKNEDLIHWEAEFARVKGTLTPATAAAGEQREELPVLLELFLGHSPNPRRVTKINEVKTPLNNYLGLRRAVIFHPLDLNLMYLGPANRREFLDRIILQLGKNYYLHLRNYSRALKQKNALLKKIKANDPRFAEASRGAAGNESLDEWNEILAQEGTKITLQRAGLIEIIGAKIENIYNQIAIGEHAEISISYRSNLNWPEEKFPSEAVLANFFRERLRNRKETEIAAGHALIGPQRDDFEISMKKRKASGHASRGEMRTLMLALKFVEMDLQQENSQSSPLLLLDDVLSELDHQRQLLLLEKVKKYQTFITTTKDSATINQEKLLPGDFLEVNRGTIRRITESQLI